MSRKLSAWKRWFGPRKPQTIRSPKPRPRRGRLQLEALEDRLAPDAQTFGGLEFLTTTGTFNVSNNVVTSTSPVQVGVAPAQGGSFTPLLLLQNGVQFNDTDATGTFTTNGAVSAFAGGTTVSLLDARAHTFQAPGLLGTNYFALGSGDTNGADLPVAGGDLSVTALHFAGQELDVQGSLSLPNFPGLSLTVGGADHVALTGSGVHLSGLDVTLAGPTNFSEAGLQFTANNVQVHYSTANNEFDLTGSASLTAAGNTLGLTLGSASAPGLVIVNGALQSLDATVDSNVKVGGLTLTTEGLTVQATAGSDLTITGRASLALDVAGQTETVGLTLGATDSGGVTHPGIDINQSTGQLVSFDAVVNSNITISKLTVQANDLGIQYDSASGTFAISGTASATVDVAGTEETISLRLGEKDSGGVNHPGIIIDANTGQLVSLDAVVNTDITISKLTVKADDLSAQYESASGTFVISGGASVVLDVAGTNETVSLQLGAKDSGGLNHPGIAIDLNTGQLISLDAVVNSNIAIAGLTVQATDLGIQYESASGTLAVSGGASAKLDVAGVEESIDLKLGAADSGGVTHPGILIDTNTAQLLSFDAVVNTDIQIAGLTIKATDLGIQYESAGGTFAISGEASATLDVAGKEESLDLKLGSADSGGVTHPGILVNANTATLVSLDAVVNTDIAVAGLTVKATDLGIQYDGTTFVISGTASIMVDVGGTVESIGVKLGATDSGGVMHPGIVVNANTATLVSFDAVVNADISIAGLTIKATDLGVQYDSTKSDIVISGGASFALDGASVSINLGGSYSPGLVIQGGQFQSLQAAVSGDIDLLGLKIKADDLTVAYVAANGTTPSEFVLFGSVGIESKFLDFSTTLGDENDPGIVVVGGKLQSLNIVVNGGFSLFGIDLAANGLTIDYSSSANELELAGGVTLDFTSAFQVSAAISQGGLIINTSTGALSVPSSGLQITASANLGPFSIRNLMIAFSNGPGGVNFSASGEVDLPGGIAVALTKLDIVNGQLADIGLSVSAPIPIGDTGFFIDTLSGSLENLNNPSQLVVSASAEVSFGEKVQIPNLGPIFAGGSFYLVDATGSITVSASELKLGGTVSLLGGLLGQGSASLDLNWGTGVYSVSGNFSMFDNIVNFAGGLTITNQGDITLQAMASVNVPPQIPFIGGDSLGTVNFLLQYQPGQPLTQDYVAAWTSVNLFVTSFTIGFQVDFQGDVSVLNGSDVAALQASAQSQPQPTQYVYSQNLNIPSQTVPNSNVVGAQITASSPIFNGAYPVTVVGSDNVSSSTGYQDYSGNVYSNYQLSNRDIILSSLSFGVTVDQDVVPGGIFAGTGSFDSQGNFHFTPSGNTSLVPIGATLSSSGSLDLHWNYFPYGTYTSSISADYDAADAYLQVLQQTTSGTPVAVAGYSIDRVSNTPGDSIQAAVPAELMVNEGLLGSNAASETQGPQTWYYLSHGAADPKTVSFSLYEGSTLLGTGYFDASNRLHFTPHGTPSQVPTGGSVTVNPEGLGILKLNWTSYPPQTSVNVSYASLGNRVIDLNLATASVPNGVPGQYIVELVSTSPLASNDVPMFSETDQFETPAVSFATGSVALTSGGVLNGTLLANAYTYAAQNPGDKTTTVSLYYNTGSYNSSGVPAAGNLIATYDYSNFSQAGGTNVRSYNFSWAGFANLPAGSYSLYAVINDGQNPPQYSFLNGPYTETNPTPTLSAPTFLALSPSGNTEQGVFSAADKTALGVTTNFTYPVTVDLKLSGGGSLVTPAGTTTTEFTQTYSSAAAAVAALDGLRFVSDSTFTGAATLTFTLTTTVGGVTHKVVDAIPLLTPNTHLVVTQSADSPIPTDPSQHTLTVTVSNPGGPDGRDGTNVRVQNALSPGLTVLSSSPSQGSFNATTGLWTVGSLPVGSSATLTLTLQADATTQGQALTNTARATSDLFNYPAADAQNLVHIYRPQPITIVVTNLNDSGPGSLRAALAAAEDGDTVQFSPNLATGTITLTSGELLINQDLTVIGPTTSSGAPGIVLSGNNAGRVLDVEGGPSGVNVTLENLAVENGLAGPQAANVPAAAGGLLVNDAGGSLTASNLLVSGNVARGGAGAHGLGGGVALFGGIATFRDDAFVNNQAVGGSGGLGLGGGLYVSGGNVTLLDDTVANNQATGVGGGQGGGLNVRGGVVTLSSDTLTANTAPVGGDVYQVAPGFVEALNTIFANWGSTSTAPDFYGTVAVSDHNLLDSTSGSTGFSTANGDLLNVNANLAPLGNYGGPTPTTPPLAGSPALGAGDPGVLTPQTIPGLVSYWRGEGSALDAAGNNNGTLVGGVTFAPGVVGTAFRLDGSTGYVQTAANPASLSINDALSVSAFVDPSVYKNDNVIIDKTQTGDAANYRFGIHGDGRLFFYNGSTAVFSNAVIPLNTFTQVGFTLTSSGALSFYVNGQLDSTRGIGFGAPNAAPVFIGRDLPGRFFQGLLDEVTVYHGVLTAAQMNTLAHPSPAVAEAGATTIPGLVSLFEGEGNARDATGTNYGSAGGTVTYTTGVVGQAFQLNGVDGQINVADSPTLNTPTFTVGGWFKVAQAPAAGSEYYLASKYDGNYHGWILRLNSNLVPTLSLLSSPSGNVNAVSSQALFLNTWYYLSATFDGTTGMLYVNGTPVGTATLPGGYATAARPLVIGGASWFSGGHFDGAIDQFSYFNRVLTPAEMRSLTLTGGSGQLQASTVGLADVYHAEGNALDSVGGNNGTLVGGVGYAPGVVGQAFQFNGAGAYAQFAPPTFGTANFSVSFWLQTSNAQFQAVLGTRVDSGHGNFFAVRMTGGHLTVELDQDGSGTNYVGFASNRLLDDGLFHQVTITRSGTAVSLYIDGVLDGSGSSAGVTNISTAHNFVVGAEPAVGIPTFRGLIDEVQIYNTALTPTQISLLHSAPGVQATATTDQQGSPRRIGGDLDIGAAEYQYDLAVSGTGPADATAGGPVNYTLSVTNNGPDPVANVTLTDVLPAVATYLSATAPQGWTVSIPGGSPGGTVIFTNTGLLAPGATATFTLSTQAATTGTTGTVLVNTASVGPLGRDTAAGNNSVTFRTTWSPGPPAGVDIHGQPADTVVDRRLGPVTVAVVDQYGNTITTNSSQLVTLSIATGPAGARLEGKTTVRAVNGVATFTNLRLNVAGTYTLEATGGKLTPDFSNPFTVAPADVSGDLRVRRGPVRRAGWFRRGVFTERVTLTNVSGHTLTGPLALVLSDLPAGVTLTDANGSYQGNPYINVRGSRGELRPGQSVTVTLTFSVTGRRGRDGDDIRFDTEALLGL